MKLFKGVNLKKLIMIASLFSAVTLFAQSYADIKKESYKIYKSGDKEGAISLVSQYSATHPESRKAQNLLATLHYWSGHNEKAKNILEDLLAQKPYPAAKKLLGYVDKKIEKITGKRVKNRAKVSYKSLRKANEISSKTDLAYLVERVQDNPKDVKTRILLTNYYLKNDMYQKAYDMAHDALKIDPNNKKMKKIAMYLKEEFKLSYSDTIDNESAVGKNKAKQLLKKLYKEARYAEYLEMYTALDGAHVSFSKTENVNILHTAIMMGEYKIAQNIIENRPLPANKNISLIEVLLTKKLLAPMASL